MKHLFAILAFLPFGLCAQFVGNPYMLDSGGGGPIARIGTASQVQASAQDSSNTITVPSGANLAVAFWAGWASDATTLNSLTLNGNSFTIQSQLASGSATNCVGVATLINPSTGSQTLDWTWSNSMDEGGLIIVIYVENANTSDLVRGASSFAAISTDAVSVTVSTETSDLLLVMAESYNGSNPSITSALTTFIDNVSYNSNIYDVAEYTPAATSTTIEMTGENWSSMSGISLK